jgi:hypothetical protein
MENISLILYTKGFFGLVLKSPTQMGSLSVNNSVTNISRLGTFKELNMQDQVTYLAPMSALYEQCLLHGELTKSNKNLFSEPIGNKTCRIRIR